jgi:hypothetical protein
MHAVLEWSKTVHALDFAATGAGASMSSAVRHCSTLFLFSSFQNGCEISLVQHSALVSYVKNENSHNRNSLSKKKT